MNEKNRIISKDELIEFTEDLLQKIKDTKISLDNEACYLIKESWYNKYIENENYNSINFPEFIYDFNDIMSCIKENNNFKFINKEFIYQLYDKKELRNIKLINYYTGNNSIIIELDKNKDNKALLIRDFTKKNKIKNKAFIIVFEDEYLTKEDKKKLFKKILSTQNNNEKDIIMNMIIPFKAYLILLEEFETKLENKINSYEENKNIYIETNQRLSNKRKELQNILMNKEEEIKNLIKEINDLKKENGINIKNIYLNDLNKREMIIKEKEKEINSKIIFLEDREIYLDNMIEENKKLIQMNNYLYKKNNELENEIYKKEIKLKEIISDLNEHEKEVEPIELYKSPTLIGLNNIGATCFMNATLQCLSQTKNLTNYFLKKANQDKILKKQNKNELQLCPVYLELIQNLWDENNMNKSYSPNKFMKVIESMNPLFKKGQPGDSKDFIIFILEQLHRELKKPVKNIIVNEPLNQYDKISAFNHFFSEFSKECSILSDLFFGINETTNICLNCKNYYESKKLVYPICYNYGIFNVLIFPLEEVKNMKINALQNNGQININNINRVSIYECFLFNQKSDLFVGENKNYCNICKQLWDSLYTSKIFIAPNILIIILNRGKGNIYNIKLEFNEVIDITQFVIEKDKPQIIYSLYGVITHLGESGPNAHFMASCKSPVDNKWYRYNDAMVNPINNIQKDIIDFGTPYILFYYKND